MNSIEDSIDHAVVFAHLFIRDLALCEEMDIVQTAAADILKTEEDKSEFLTEYVNLAYDTWLSTYPWLEIVC